MQCISQVDLYITKFIKWQLSNKLQNFTWCSHDIVSGAQLIQTFSLNWIKGEAEIPLKLDSMLLKFQNRISWYSKLLYARVVMDANP